MNGHSEQPLLESFKERELEVLRLVAEGWTNRDIAEELVISVNTVRWHMKQIYSKLGVHSRTLAIAQARDLGLLDDQPRSEPVISVPRHNLPFQLTPFIGRRHEIDNISELLRTSRLLTLTGPGGTGKTRLALHVVGEVADSFRNGVYFVSLAPLNDHALVVNAIADVLNVIENSGEPLIETLKRALSGRQTLLLIDNFEHVINAAPLVPELLAVVSTLKVLVTSREPLHVSGEQVYPVPPLLVPDLKQIESFPVLAACESVALFTQRAQAVRPDFTMTEENVHAVAEICVRLDGLPLAIELAAARSALLPPHSIVERLDNRFNTLAIGSRDAPTRQQTLRDTIDWSFNLLDDADKILFARLSVFRGGRTLEAVEAVCGDNLPVDIFDSLASLVDKSMIRQEDGVGGEPRFVMLETIQEYARERLEASGDLEILRDRHADYFLSLAERAEPELQRANQILWLDRLDEEHDNLRATLEWLLATNDNERALRLAGALGWFWFIRMHAVEGYRWLERALEQGADVAPAVRAKALNVAGGRLAFDMGDHEQGRVLQEEALVLARETGDKSSLAWALGFLGINLMASHEYDRVEALASEALSLFREIVDQHGIAWSLNCLAEVQRFRGAYERAETLYNESLLLHQEIEDLRGIGMALNNLAYVAHGQGHYQRATKLFEQVMAVSIEIGSKASIADGLAGLAAVAVATGQLERGVRLLAVVETNLYDFGLQLAVLEHEEYANNVAMVREQLDEATFETAWAEGRAMSLEEAIAYAHAD